MINLYNLVHHGLAQDLFVLSFMYLQVQQNQPLIQTTRGNEKVRLLAIFVDIVVRMTTVG